MANVQTGSITPANYIDKRAGRDKGSQAQAEHANLSTVATLRARLTALAPASYTAARLDAMTVNDMQYALRLASADSAGI
jgi:hypothetical protein